MQVFKIVMIEMFNPSADENASANEIYTHIVTVADSTASAVKKAFASVVQFIDKDSISSIVDWQDRMNVVNGIKDGSYLYLIKSIEKIKDPDVTIREVEAI